MKLYYVISGTADNYILAEMSDGLRWSNCAPDGKFADVSLHNYGADGEEISGEEMARRIAEAIDPDISESDLSWMDETDFETLEDWAKSMDGWEPWQRDKEFFIREF